MKKAFIFRGAPASGKGTITKEFLKLIPGKVAFLELDTFRWEFHAVNQDVIAITNDDHQMAYKNYLSVLENYLKDGSYTIVTEGLFSWNTASPHGNVQDIISLCKQYGYEYQSIVLSADQEILWERNLAREYVVPEEEFGALYSHVMEEVDASELTIDVEKNSVSESVGILQSLL
jgi:predicted kinase